VAVPALYCATALVSYLVAARSVVRAGSPVGPLAWLVLYPLVRAATCGANLGIGHGLGRVAHESYDGFRYLVPLYPVLLVLMAWMLTRAWQAGSSQRLIAGVVTLALLVAGLASTVQLLSSRNVGRAAVYAATSYKEFAFQRGDGPSMDLDGLSSADRHSYLLGRGWSASERLLQGAPRPDDVALPRTTDTLVLPAELGSDPLGEHLTCAALGARALRLHPRNVPVAEVVGDAVGALSGRGLSASCEWQAFTALGASLRVDALPYYRLDATVRDYVQAVVVVAARVPARSRSAVFEGLGQGVGIGLESQSSIDWTSCSVRSICCWMNRTVSACISDSGGVWVGEPATTRSARVTSWPVWMVDTVPTPCVGCASSRHASRPTDAYFRQTLSAWSVRGRA